MPRGKRQALSMAIPSTAAPNCLLPVVQTCPCPCLLDMRKSDQSRWLPGAGAVVPCQQEGPGPEKLEAPTGAAVRSIHGSKSRGNNPQLCTGLRGDGFQARLPRGALRPGQPTVSERAEVPAIGFDDWVPQSASALTFRGHKL
jgi:hypothetical protein